MSPQSLFAEFAKVAQTNPRKTAITFRQGTRYLAVTYRQLYLRSIELGRLLIKKGLSPAERVAIVIGNQPEWPISFMAIQFAGAVAVPLDTKLPPEEIRALILHSQAKILLCTELKRRELKDALGSLEHFEMISVDLLELTPAPTLKDEGRPVEASVQAAFFYTSGTTGAPKAAMLSQTNILSNIDSMKNMGVATSKDVFIALLPLHHTYSFTATCIFPLLLGAQIVYFTGFNADELVRCLQETKATILTGVPQFFALVHRTINENMRTLPSLPRFLLNVLLPLASAIRCCAGINGNKLLLSKLHRSFGRELRLMISGGARLEPNIARDFFKWGFTILEGYGLTETSPVVAFNRPKKFKIGSVGMPVPGVHVKINNPDRKGRGEIAVYGHNVMLGYYNLPEETTNVIRDGWFFTGDLGYIDRNGFLYIAGRKDEMIVLSSGEKINPEEIERYYGATRFVKELCVFSLQSPEDETGQNRIMAVVVPDEDYFKQVGQANIEERIRWEFENVSNRLPSFKRINGFILSGEKLPRTLLGKLMRYKIREDYSGEAIALKTRKTKLSFEDLALLADEANRRVLEYISKQLKREVSLDDYLELDLGLDSLSRIGLLLDIQNFLQTEVPESLAMELFYARTIKELVIKAAPILHQGTRVYNEKGFSWAQALVESPKDQTLKMIRLTPVLADKLFTFFIFILLKSFFTLFCRMRVEGKECLPENGPCIIYANHTTYFDGLIVASALPFTILLKTYFLGFRQYFYNPYLKKTVRSARFIPVDVSMDIAETLKSCAYVLRNGKMICLFPEGERAVKGEVIRFKRGIGILAKELNIPLLPIYLDGAYNVWPRGKRLPSPAKVTVKIGTLIWPAELPAGHLVGEEAYELVAEHLRQKLIATKSII